MWRWLLMFICLDRGRVSIHYKAIAGNAFQTTRFPQRPLTVRRSDAMLTFVVGNHTVQSVAALKVDRADAGHVAMVFDNALASVVEQCDSTTVLLRKSSYGYQPPVLLHATAPERLSVLCRLVV